MDINQSKTDLEKTLNEVLNKEGYLNRNIEILPIPQNAASYLSIINEVNVTGTTKNGIKEIKLFIKRPIGTNGNIISMEKAFKSEAFFYNDLSKVYEEMQEEANIPLEERYSVVKSYSLNSDAIVLENLKYEGYKTFDITDVVSLEFAELAMAQLAKLHALSFALQIKRPDYFLEKDIPNKRLPWTFDAEWIPYVEAMGSVTANLMDRDYKEKIESILPTLHKEFERIMLPSENDVCCLCHGDYRASNILTAMTNGKPTKIIPIDYQHIHYSSPATDILTFITLATDQKFRKTHLTYLKDHYYEAMVKFLEYFNLDAKIIYPKYELEKAYKSKSFLSFVLAIGSMPFAYVDNETCPDFEDIENYKFKLKPSFVVKVKEIFQEYFNP